jgi:tRNA pseudouridine55 synthase
MVRVYDIQLVSYAWPLLKLRIDCGRGVYIRAIARDLGEALNTGGYLVELRRTRVGPFKAADAVPLDTLRAASVDRWIVPLEQARLQAQRPA